VAPGRGKNLTELFDAKGAILVRNVMVGEGLTDIFIDREGMIAGMGEGTRKEFRGEAEFLIEGNGGVALPGLVNTHTHAAMTLLRGYADDMPLQEWLSQKIWPLEAHLTGDDVYRGTMLACMEMIRTGTTAFNDMYFFMERAAEAVDRSGIRATLAHGFIDLSLEEKRESEIKATEHLISHVRSLRNPRIKAAVGPHAIYTVSPEGLTWCAEYAKEQDIGIHIHLSETEQEVTDCVARYNARPPAHLDRCGCLTPRTVAAHCCWLDREDCRLLGERGAYASHNPASNMKLAVNRAMPCHWLTEAGAGVALGTDGCASNNNLDMMEEMKFAALLQKFYWNSQTLLPARDTVRMATETGARALRIGPGTLMVGAPADLIILDPARSCMVPLHHSDSNVVYSCNGDAVKTTICDGRVLMLDRFIPGEAEVLKEAARTAQDLVERGKDSPQG
jgi:5-methylthioadenosine/S-adenosylhomocysteine deaminase